MTVMTIPDDERDELCRPERPTYHRGQVAKAGAYQVSRAWGFEPVTLLTWCKPGPGVGRFRCNTEHVLVARKGSRHGNPFGQGGRHAQATGGTYFDWPRGKHSAKPQHFYDLVERLSPGPYLEMFAREPRMGWSVWGDEVDCDVQIGGAA